MKLHALIIAGLLGTTLVGGCTHDAQPRLSDEADADIPLWPQASLDIRQTNSKLVGCLPKNEQQILLQKAAVASIDAGWPPPEWAIELIPSAKPVLIRPGQCVTYGSTPEGYRQIGGMQPLQVGRTYGFMLLRGNSIKRKEDRRYLSLFCIKQQSDGRLAYLPYVSHPDGSVTYPVCGSYIGAPPAPDGFDPLQPASSYPIRGEHSKPSGQA